jgi:adenylate kinase family enzyme
MNIPSAHDQPLQRVAIIGTSCSGKTTFATHLASILQVRHIELDALYWLPNWVSRSTDDFRSLTREATSAERWVADGNYGSVRDIVWSRATALIWLNYSFSLVASRALRRTTKRILTQQELFSGNRETFRKAFLSRDSILWWVVQTHRRRRGEYPLLFQEPQYQHLRVFVMNTPKKAAQFLHRITVSISSQPNDINRG